jgi:hypothetical protein
MTAEEAFIKATKARAKAYYYLYEEMVKEFGVQKADKVFSKAMYNLGLEKAETFRPESKDSAEILADEFVKDGLGKKVFSQTVIESSNLKAVIEMRSCPLVAAWKEMNLSEQKIKKLCDMAHQIDFGTVEGKGLSLNFPNRIACGDESCLLEVYKKTGK